MQIDFHHGVTYVLARLAGFKHEQANIVAYSAQYVDDATNGGTIKFENRYMYRRIASAHKMLDYRNSKQLANHRVWIPFHFLPGNGGMKAGKNPVGKGIKKMVCRPNSYVARDMVKACIRDKEKLYGLHLLGVTMHAYADTWAHQGFAGVNHEINDASEIKKGGERDTSMIDKVLNFFIGEAYPLGHGSVLSYPDRPYLQWSYTNDYLGKEIQRDNPKDFLQAADQMCRAMQGFIRGNPGFESQQGLANEDKKQIDHMLRNTQMEDGEDRHKVWLKAIKNGKFSFGAAKVKYVPKGSGSWKHKALGTKEWTDDDDEKFKFKETFLTSDWKLFHDALQAHRFRILHDILPQYNICAA